MFFEGTHVTKDRKTVKRQQHHKLNHTSFYTGQSQVFTGVRRKVPLTNVLRATRAQTFVLLSFLSQNRSFAYDVTNRHAFQMEGRQLKAILQQCQ